MDETYFYVTVVLVSFISFPNKFGSPVLLELAPGAACLFPGALLKQKGGERWEKIPGEEPSKSRITTANYHSRKN